MPELFIAMIFAYFPWIANLPRPTRPPAAARALHLLPDGAPSWLGKSDLVSNAARKAVDEPTSWLELGYRGDGPKRTLGREIDLDVARVKSRIALTDADAIVPLRRTGLETEDTLKLPLSRTFFLVGRVGANSGSLEQQQYKLVGATGLGMKLPLGGELQMRRGRSMTNYDPDDLAMLPEQAKDFLEVTTRWTLPGDINFEYTHESISPLTSGRDLIRRDVRLAFPLSNSGKFQIGAKQQDASPGSTTPWFERMKLYLGVELKR